MTYPAPEGYSANAMAFVINATNVLALAIFPYLSALLVNPLCFFVFVACTVMVFFVQEQYKRSDYLRKHACETGTRTRT